MASKDIKVSNHIPNDLAFSILSKLPIVSIKRFSCVHKSWALLFQNPNFLSAVGKNFISQYNSFYDDTCLMLKRTQGYDNRCVFDMLSGERFENRVRLDLPLPFQDDDTCIQILGSSINGIICLYQEGDHSKIVLWKPTAKEFTIIPSDNVNYLPYSTTLTKTHGFGYDSVSDDYKVIRHATLFERDTDSRSRNYLEGYRLYISKSVGKFWEIYSMRSNSWRKLDIDMPLRINESVVVYMNGMCHWWGIKVGKEYVVSFDLSNDVFLTTPTPLDMCDNSNLGMVERHLVVLNMSISLISNYAMNTTFHISVLGQLGVRESWTKLFIVGPLLGVEHPIGVGKRGNIFFRKENYKLAYLDLSTEIIEEIGIQGESHFCQIVIYKS
ncbi:putative F-box protein At3g16210 [Trifolium pratense]|uniref:putative F-box protein At3g16210 n=1 Tax=Trifolium pratense TaxID=57577 RepID=UPI001E693E2E|nr:putative F-box protein At3g16210 [Trifolium pratense]